ncbi:MAG: class I SAM-dependent methyltransferase [Chloroflexota bacterium]
MTNSSPILIPEPNQKRIAIRVKKNVEQKIREGHPWVYDNSITELSFEGRAGDLAVIFDSKRKFLGIGLYDPRSPIRIKLLHAGSPAQINADWFQQTINNAVQKRHSLLSEGTTGYRVIYGEGDYLPGLIVDRYGETLVIKLYSEIWLPYLSMLSHRLQIAMPEISRGVLRLNRQLMQLSNEGQLFGMRDGYILFGPQLEGPVSFTENRLNFAADVIRGHKTGFFFDHRDNRRRVGLLSKGKRVLDLFAYAGGFSLFAAAGGAKSVVSVDISRPALEAAQQNFALNQDLPEVKAAVHTTRAVDVFDYLKRLDKDQKKFDLIVVDPPAFAKNSREVDRAMAAYERLMTAVLPLLVPQGLLVFASCSSHIPLGPFFNLLFDTAELAGRPLWEQARTAHGLDHPLRPKFPEGEYLKCLYATTID